jgi:hypothetical protein
MESFATAMQHLPDKKNTGLSVCPSTYFHLPFYFTYLDETLYGKYINELLG